MTKFKCSTLTKKTKTIENNSLSNLCIVFFLGFEVGNSNCKTWATSKPPDLHKLLFF